MTTTSSIHKRSRSDPVPKRSLKNNISREAIYNIDRFHMVGIFKRDQKLQREIEQLKSLVKCRKLQHQRVSCDEIDLLFQEDKVLVQREMETVLRRKLFLEDCKNKDPSIPKEAKKLVSEIAGLEMQVMYLERYLLLLYRRFFNNKITAHLDPEEKEISEDLVGSTNLIDSPKTAVCSPQKVLEDSGIFRSHSSLSHCSGYSFRMSPQAMDSSYHHSLPFSMLEQADIDAMVGTYVSQNVTESPNSLSEEMIKCISEVFRQLADPESLDDDRESSSSPFRRKGHQKVIGRPYDKLLVLKSICRDSEKLNEVEPALKHFRSLVSKLEGVNPRKLNHEEKLAFWINIHNSLVMHSILVYGNPKNSMKRLSGLLKAAYNVGGRSLNLDTIQSSILRCRVSRPGQVFRFLFASKPKGKAGDLGKDYAITHPEPLLHFALCSGNFSDPSVRIYTPKNVMMELECGKEEYVRSNVGISKDNKILLPKLVELYAKDTELCHVGILDAIVNYLPCDARNKVQQCMNKKHGRFTIDWVAHDFRFRLLL